VKKPTSSNLDDNNYDIETDDEAILTVLQKSMQMGGAGMYVKGDKIQVTLGDLSGLKGTVVAIEESGMITFKPLGIKELTKPLQIELANVTKYFEPGDLVRITEGKYKGETGQVIEIDGNKCNIVLDST